MSRARENSSTASRHCESAHPTVRRVERGRGVREARVSGGGGREEDMQGAVTRGVLGAGAGAEGAPAKGAAGIDQPPPAPARRHSVSWLGLGRGLGLGRLTRGPVVLLLTAPA